MLSLLRSTLKNTFIYSVGTFSSRLAGFILIPLYTSQFEVSEYGMMGIMEVSAQVLLAVLGFSLYNAYFRWYWDKQYADKQKSILFTILTFLAFQFLLILLLIALFRQSLSQFLFASTDHGYLVLLLLYVSGLEALGVMVSTLLRLKEKAALYTVLQVAKLLFSLFLTYYLIKYRDRGIEAVYESQLFANVFYLLLIIPVLRRNTEFKFETNILKEMLQFSFPLMLSSLSGIVLNIADRYSLRFLADLATVGIYSLGFKVANTIRVFVVTSVNLALQPIIFKMMDAPENKRFYSKVMTYYSLGVMIPVLFFSLFSTEIIKIVSRNMEYWEAAGIIPVLSFSMLFGVMRDVSYTGLNINKKTKTIALLVFLASLMNVGLNLLFISIWSFRGAAYATALSQFLFFIAVYFTAQKVYPIPYEVKKIITLVVLGILVVALGSLLQTHTLAVRLVVKCFIILSFPSILYFFGFYEPVEIERLKQGWIKWRNPLKWPKNLKNIKFN